MATLRQDAGDVNRPSLSEMHRAFQIIREIDASRESFSTKQEAIQRAAYRKRRPKVWKKHQHQAQPFSHQLHQVWLRERQLWEDSVPSDPKPCARHLSVAEHDLLKRQQQQELAFRRSYAIENLIKPPDSDLTSNQGEGI